MSETQATHTILLNVDNEAEDTYSMESDLGSTKSAVFKATNKELSLTQHAALKVLAMCVGNINKVFGPIDSLHIEKIP